MLIEKSVKEYCEQVDSMEPAPGGGSVAALVGALACALSRMYGHFSITKKAFQQLDISVQSDFESHFVELKNIEHRLLQLIDEDALLYPKILAAYRLPKTNEEEMVVRNHAIQEATLLAIEGPHAIATCAYQALIATEGLLPYGNKKVISDAACAIILLEATIETAIINMEINIVSLTDIEMKNKYQHVIADLRKQTKEKKEQLMMIAHPLS